MVRDKDVLGGLEMAQKSTTVSKALEMAKEQDQDVFLASLNKEQLERTGFDTSTFGPFEYVDIYVLLYRNLPLPLRLPS